MCAFIGVPGSIFTKTEKVFQSITDRCLLAVFVEKVFVIITELNRWGIGVYSIKKAELIN